MSKKRRTKREKIIADLRKELSQTRHDTQSPLREVKKDVTIQQSIPSIKEQPKAIREYSYVSSDMKNTARIVSLILLVNLILAFLFEKNILVIPF